ncbi:hypothetical protein F4604DRAFT_1686629 [Suillus subluteus]|nr:hypothetical protein F4604DRAFT_1686629 [Suillus subluteus]
MIRYNKALDKRSTGRITKHEEALLEKFPHGSQQLLNKPSVLVDSGGHIILWYLPDAISPWIQAKMEEATVSMGYLLKTSMTGGEETKWRTFPEYFHMSDWRPLTPGCINIAPCWFQQGREVRLASFTGMPVLTQLFQPYGFPPSSVFTPEVSATLKGEGGPMVIISMQRSALLASAALQIKLGRWAVENGLDDIYTRLQLWASVFNCAAVICNRQCPLHRDPRSAPEGFNVMTSVSHYDDGFMTLSNLGIQLRYNSGAIIGCSGCIVRHGVTFTGDHIMWAWFMCDSLHNFVGTPRPQYATYVECVMEYNSTLRLYLAV